MWRSVIVAVALAPVYLAPAKAASIQSNDPCLAALKKDTYSGRLSVSETLVALDTANQSDFNEAKQNASASGTFYCSGLPMPVTADWQQFNQRKAEYKSLHKIDYSLSESLSWTVQRTSPEAFKAFVACQSRTRPFGIYLAFNFHPNDYKLGTIHVDFYPFDSTTHALSFLATTGQILGPTGWSSNVVKAVSAEIHFDLPYCRQEERSSAIVTATTDTTYNDSVDILKRPAVSEFRKIDSTLIRNEVKISLLRADGKTEKLCLRDKITERSQTWKFVKGTGNVTGPELAPGGCSLCKGQVDYQIKDDEDDICWIVRYEENASGGLATFRASGIANKFDWVNISP